MNNPLVPPFRAGLVQWKSLTPPQQTQAAISVASAGAVLALYLFVLVLPTIQRLYVTVPETMRMARELQRMQQSISNRTEMEQHTAALRARLDQMQQPFWLEGEVSTTALETLSNLARVSGIKIEVMQPMKPEVPPDAAEARCCLDVPIRIDAKGGYHQLGEFLDSIEHHQQLFQVRRLEISSDPAEVRRHDIRLVLLASVLRESVRHMEPAAP